MSEAVLRSSGVTTTIMGVLNQFQAFTNLPYASQYNTTLNRKRGVLTGYTQPETYPILSYYGIGVKGYQNTDMEQGSAPYAGDARCMDLYKPIPIKCIPLSELKNMTEAERTDYRMCAIQLGSDGVTQYACFYLKKIKYDGNISIRKKNADGTSDEYVLEPDIWLLNPTPVAQEQIGGSVNTNINRIVVRATGVCTVTYDEVMSTVNALYGGDANYARISEIGYYTGVEVPCVYAGENSYDAVKTDGVPLFYEAGYVQLAKHHCFRGAELFTAGSYISPRVSLESECCINTATNNV